MSGGAGFTGALRSRLATAERNIAVNTLRDIIDAGWDLLLIVSGIADEFEDQTGVDAAASTGETYDSAGDYYANAGEVERSATPGGGTTAFGVTIMDRSFTVDNGRSVVAIDVYRLSASSQVVKLFKRNSSGNYDVVHSEAFSHPGGGWARKTLSAPYAVPSDGASYYVGVYDAGSLEYNGSTARAYKSGDITGNGQSGFTEDSSFTIAVGVQYGAQDMVLVSEEFSADVAPNVARAVLLHQSIDAVTLNTDCTIEVSRDGGTTWTAGALSDQGAFDATTQILAAEIDLSGQPSDTAMKYRFSAMQEASQRLHGVWLQWG